MCLTTGYNYLFIYYLIYSVNLICEVGITLLILEMIKLSIREVLFIFQNHIASKWQSWALNKFQFDPKGQLFSPLFMISLGSCYAFLWFSLYSLHSISFFLSSLGSLKNLHKWEDLLTLQVTLVPLPDSHSSLCVCLV